MKRLKSWKAVIVVLAVLWMSPGSFAEKRARVLVDSWANEQYDEAKLEDGKPRYETYHFLKGRHFGGYLRDKSLRDVEFGEMVEALAGEMRKRNYYPSRVPEHGDFLIIVHWGVTGIQESFDELRSISAPISMANSVELGFPSVLAR